MKNYKIIFILFLTIAITLTASAQNSSNDAQLLDLYQNQRYDQAAALIKSSYPEPVTDMKVLSRLAYTYQMAGKLPVAEGYYQRMLLKDSTSIPVLFNLATINVSRDNSPRAILYYKKITKLDSTNYVVYKQLGRLTNDMGLKITYLQKANKLNPEDDVVAADLGNMMIGTKQYKTAQKILTKALAADSSDLLLLRPMLTLTYELKKYNETIKAGTAIMAVGDMTYPVVSKVAESYYMLKNFQCCIETFALLPDIFQSEASYYFVAESYKALKNYPQAVNYFNLTLKQSISANTNLYYSEMADTYNEMNQLKNTINSYQKSLFFKEDGLVYYSLANIYDTKLKDKKDALKYYKKYLDTKPPLKEKSYADYALSRVTELKK